MFVNSLVYVKNINKSFLVNDYKVNKMFIVFNLKFFMLFYTLYLRCLIYQRRCRHFYIIKIVQLFSDTFKRLISLPVSFILDKRRIICQKQITKLIQILQVV